MTDSRLTILHLRTASGGGGGPDKTLLKTGERIDAGRFRYVVAYLRRRERSVAPIFERARAAGLDYREFPGGAFFDLAQLRAVAACVRETGADVLHAHDPKSDLYGLLLRRRFPGAALVSTMHGWLPGRRRRFSNRLDLWALRRCDLVLAVSKSTEALARERGGLRNTRVLYNAVDAVEWRREAVGADEPPVVEDRDPAAPLVVFAGRLSPEKGPRDFLRVAAAVRARRPDARFALAGDGPEEVPARALAQELGLGDAVRFLGRLEAPRMRRLYVEATALLSPSHTEGLPNNVLEAAAMRTPIVATRVGGVGEVVEEGVSALLAEAGDVEGLAARVLRVIEDAPEAGRLADAARRVIEDRFSLEARTRRIEAVYEEIAAVRKER